MKKELTRETVLETLGVLALACLVAGYLLRGRPLAGKAFFAAASLLLALGLFAQPLARPIAAAWLGAAAALGAVNSRLLLTLIFFVFLTPLAALARLFRGDVLQLRRRAGRERSYWQRRDRAWGPKDLRNPW